MDNLEFVMTTDLAALPKQIDFNFEALKAALSDGLAYYTGLVVTDDDIKNAKADRAKLNKLREALDAKRKDVKKECLVPYTDFEAKVKELTGMIDKPIAAIDGQLKTYEDRRRAEKRAEIEAAYREEIGDLAELLPFERVWEDGFYNVAVTVKKAREAIIAKIARTRDDLETLSTVESELAEAVKLRYLETGDLGAALQERARLAEQAERLREYERQIAATQTAPAKEYEAEETQEREAPRDTRFDAPTEEADAAEPRYLLRFEVQITKAQARRLAEYLKANDISYRRI